MILDHGGIILKVQEVLIHEKKRFLLIDNGGYPVTSVAKYIKYLDNIGKAESTLKSYCYHLKLYFQFLEECGLEYQEVNLDILAQFIGWLRIPDQSTKVTYFEETLAKRSEKTVNTIITCVIGVNVNPKVDHVAHVKVDHPLVTSNMFL